MKEFFQLKSIVALAKRRGFVFPGSEIYGGFANTYSFGPYGTEMKNNLKALWWKWFIHEREDMVGIDGPILLHPAAWKASGHVEGFNDALVDCKECKSRYRIDHLIEAASKQPIEGKSLEQLSELLKSLKIHCPHCGKQNFTDARYFNLMFSTHMSKTSNGTDDLAFLRPETAQAIFLDYKNIIDTQRVKIPFGIGQIGKAFRNEITPGNFIFRVIEFEQMEIEYFIQENSWEHHFDAWLKNMHTWCEKIGLSKTRLKEKEHTKEELSHYSKRTVDILFHFPFGWQELYGLAYRGNFDLSRHQQFSKTNLEYTDPETQEKYLPHVIEPTFGVDRTLLALLCNAYDEEKLPSGEMRTVLHLSSLVAPVKIAVFPLMKKEPLQTKARELFSSLKELGYVEYDDGGAIGRRYRRQDELGTPYCITIDYQTLEDSTVTLRDRDTMEQKRFSTYDVKEYLKEKLAF